MAGLGWPVRWAASLVAACLVLGALAVAAAPSAPARAADAKTRRRAVQAERARKAGEVAALRSTDRQVRATLSRARQDVGAAERALASARSAWTAAARAASDARATELATAAKLQGLRTEAREVAVGDFMAGRRAFDPQPMFGDSPTISMSRNYLAGVAVGRAVDVRDGLRSTLEDLGVERVAAAAAARRAETRARDLARRTTEVRQSEQRQAATASQIEARLEQRLAEAANLETLDAALAAQILSQQRAIARRLPRRAVGGSAPIQVGSISLTTVRGIVVSTRIAARLGRLIAAAAADGISLSGGGYRSSAAQIASRRAHCGSSSYDIYRKPASQCSPPSARPGLSMHEKGLAIDFTSGGAIVSSRSRAYRWLRAHAGSYGLKNLPGEPWHWSTNGR